MNTTKIDRLELKRIQEDFPKMKITSSEDAYKYIKQFYSDDISIYESFFILLLNKSNTTIGYAKISQGGLCGTIVDVRIIAKYAIESLSSSIILAHNHPSENTIPSDEDKHITTKIKNTLNIFDVKVFDHIILTENAYFSFADNYLI